MTQTIPGLGTNGPNGASTELAVSKLHPEASDVGVELVDGSTVVATHGEQRYLVVSPYLEQEHLLDLETVDEENQMLAAALQSLKCLREDYATAPYTDTFNWADVVAVVKKLAEKTGHAWKETSFYIVAFRSQIPPTTTCEELGTLDKAAHAEATASGGFLKYWFGTPDADGRNLATCIWRSREDAKQGGVGPAHRRASGATRTLYSHWKIDRHRLIIRDGVQSWDLVEWTD